MEAADIQMGSWVIRKRQMILPELNETRHSQNKETEELANKFFKKQWTRAPASPLMGYMGDRYSCMHKAGSNMEREHTPPLIVP